MGRRVPLPDTLLPFLLSPSLPNHFFDNHSTNAAAGSFNAKAKHLRAQLHGVIDKKFFPFQTTCKDFRLIHMLLQVPQKRAWRHSLAFPVVRVKAQVL